MVYALTEESGRIDRSRVRSPSAPFLILMETYFVYVLKSESGSSYVGHTSALDKRLFEHNSGKSISTRSKRPWKLVYKEEYQTRSEAASRERYFKSVAGRIELKTKRIL